MKTLLLAVSVFLLQSFVVQAQTPYFQGKTIRIVSGYPAGDVNDLWPRLIAQHMTKYIPGNPNFVIQNMTGAGSMIAANYVYRRRQAGRADPRLDCSHSLLRSARRAQRGPIRLGQVQLHRLAIGERASSLYAHGQPVQNH